MLLSEQENEINKAGCGGAILGILFSSVVWIVIMSSVFVWSNEEARLHGAYQTRRDAAEAGAGEFYSDPQTGERGFRWFNSQGKTLDHKVSDQP